MAFFSTLISTVLKMLFVAAFAFLGIMTGKQLRKRKNEKQATDAE